MSCRNGKPAAGQEVNDLKALKDRLMVALFYANRVFPIRNNKIVVSNFSGKGYGESPKAIVDELLRRGREYDIVWLVDRMDETFPAKVRKVRRLSLAAVREQVTARVWIDNRRKPGYVRKRRGQYYIQTWHGNMGLKRVELDVRDSMSPAYIEAALRDSKMADLFLSGSRFDTLLYRSAFAYHGEILECGYPRQDILVSGDAAKEQALRKTLGLRPEEKAVIYAPTFRQQALQTDVSVYRLDWAAFLNEMERRFGGKWRGLLRLHPSITKLSAKLDLPDNVLDVTAFPGFQELLLISDCVVTDYSSTILEAGIVGKLGLIIAKDMEEYKKDRDFYIPLEQFPFPIATSDEALCEAVRSFDEEAYQARAKAFFEGDYGLFPPGGASAAVADRIDAVTAKKR